MGVCSTAFVGIDVSKARNAVAIADEGRQGEIRYLGEFPNTKDATRKLVKKLVSRNARLHFCYEAGPTGYGLYRWLRELEQDCIVVAPSMIPQRSGDRVKTNRRDAEGLARLLRAGELTSVWVPRETHEAIRDLVRVRHATSRDIISKRRQVSALLLKYGVSYPGKTTWGARHARWLSNINLDLPARNIAFGEMVNAVRDAEARLKRLEAVIEELMVDWELHDLVTALQALRGFQLIAAITIVSELGDLARFENPRQLMAFVGLVPSERSTGCVASRGGITKTGNSIVRKTLVESAWCYRHAPRVGAGKLAIQKHLSQPIIDLGWKAQVRLCGRYRKLTAAGKRNTVVVTAIARELAGFIWAIAQEVRADT